HATQAREKGAGAGPVGRTAEVRRLRALVDDLAAGSGAAVWVEGATGIGKTTVLTAGLASAVEAGCQVAWGTAEDLDRFVPLRVVARALKVCTAAADRAAAGPAAGPPAAGLAAGPPVAGHDGEPATAD